MKLQLFTLTVAGALALGSLTAHAEDEGKRWHGGGGGGHGGMHQGMMLEHLTKTLDLTPQQQAQIAPIVEQARPQMKAIHEEAMQKAHAVIENTANQIRPLLTPQQQSKFDALKKAHEDMKTARRAMHEAKTK